jgi:1,4-dihydroxy-2-naphthoyl-CoA synthase
MKNVIVVIGAGTTFVAGADIKEFAKVASGEKPRLNLSEILLEIENSSKPVVMAIHGTALGGGLELALHEIGVTDVDGKASHGDQDDHRHDREDDRLAGLVLHTPSIAAEHSCPLR